MTKPKDAEAVLKMMKEKEVKYVDLRFTDPRGKMQHVTMDVSQINEEAFAEGLMFDGSSIAGWKAINESDMVLMPDPDLGPYGPLLRADDDGDVLRHSRADDRRRLYPRSAHDRQARRGLSQADQGRRYGLCRTRSRILHLRRRALRRLRPTIPASSSTRSNCRPTCDREYETGNLGHRMRTKGGYFPVNPQDSAQDMRSEMLSVMARDGRHRREAPSRSGRRPARARHEIRHAGHHGRPDADL